MKVTGLTVFAFFSLAACASSNWPPQTTALKSGGVPDHFLVLDTATGAMTEPDGASCHNPMTDPRDGTRLTLVRSNSGFGDYRPDTPKYGLTGKQLLRIGCSDGRPAGATAGLP